MEKTVTFTPEAMRMSGLSETGPAKKMSRKRPIARQTRRLRDAIGEGEVRRRVMERGNREAGRERVLIGAEYVGMVREMKEKYKIAIRRWRPEMAGLAYELTYRDGRIKRLISAPRPRSPVSAAIFLHEVGHHAIGFRRYHVRCLEEHYVWQWTFREMYARGIPVTERVQRHFRRSMHHYVRRARRNGEHVPGELMHFGHWAG